MMFDSQHDAGAASRATSFEPMTRSSAAAKKSLRGRAGALLTTTALVTAASAMVALEAGAQVGVPTGFAPAPADVHGLFSCPRSCFVPWPAPAGHTHRLHKKLLMQPN